MLTSHIKHRRAVTLLSMLASVPLAALAGSAYAETPPSVKQIFQTTVAPSPTVVIPAQFGDNPKSQAQMSRPLSAMPPLNPGEYGTHVDNENNANTHSPDYDMSTYLYNTDAITPIEFNIDMPAGSAGKTGELRMDVYDIDAKDGEVDKVYFNNFYVGTLNGTTDTWGVNYFTIPPGIMVDGPNLVRVDIDTKNPGKGVWAVTVDWGIIKTAASSSTIDISRCWVAPPRQKFLNYVNFWAELNNPVDSVITYIAGRAIPMTEVSGNMVWSAEWQIPKATDFLDAIYPVPFYMVAIKDGKVQSMCPTLRVETSQ